MKNIFVGIDVSNKTLDICIKEEGSKTFCTIENSVKSCVKLFNLFKSKEMAIKIAMENTGRYNYNLYEALEKFSFNAFVINPIHMKKSLGLVRGKNDKVDSERIVFFIGLYWVAYLKWCNLYAVGRIKLNDVISGSYSFQNE